MRKYWIVIFAIAMLLSFPAHALNVASYIRPYDGQAERFRMDLRQGAETEPGLELLDQILSLQNPEYGTGDLVFLTLRWGLSDAEDLLDFLKSYRPVRLSEIQKDITPFVRIDLASLGTIDRMDLINYLKSNLPLHPNFNWDVYDDSYRLPTREIITSLLPQSPSCNLPYRDGDRDCDNFRQIFRGWIARLGYGSLAIGDIDIYWMENGQTYGHGMLITLTDQREIILIDPQCCMEWEWTMGLTEIGVGPAISKWVWRVEF